MIECSSYMFVYRFRWYLYISSTKTILCQQIIRNLPGSPIYDWDDWSCSIEESTDENATSARLVKDRMSKKAITILHHIGDIYLHFVKHFPQMKNRRRFSHNCRRFLRVAFCSKNQPLYCIHPTKLNIKEKSRLVSAKYLSIVHVPVWTMNPEYFWPPDWTMTIPSCSATVHCFDLTIEKELSLAKMNKW